jgi:DNA-binding transcriptional ArsR family regulator
MLHDPDQGRISTIKLRALSHPVRLRIVELVTSDPDRSLAAAALTTELTADFPDLSIPLVAYHLRRLQDARLVPVPAGS